MDDEVLAEVTARVDGSRATVDIGLAALAHGEDRERLLWTPEHPTLVDARVVVQHGGTVLDEVRSYGSALPVLGRPARPEPAADV